VFPFDVTVVPSPLDVTVVATCAYPDIGCSAVSATSTAASDGPAHRR
jgi:hypothetical protein